MWGFFTPQATDNALCPFEVPAGSRAQGLLVDRPW